MNLSDINARSVCPLASTLEIIGDRWTLLIVRDMMAGSGHFKEFESSPERISTNILSDRLSKLVAWGIAEKFRTSRISSPKAYRLTELGESLRPVMEAIADWGLEYIEGTEKRINTAFK